MARHVTFDMNDPALIEVCLNCAREDCPGGCMDLYIRMRELRGMAPMPQASVKPPTEEETARAREKARAAGASKTPTFYVEAFGQRKSLPDWASETGIPYNKLYARILRHGWPAEEALTTLDATKRHANRGTLTAAGLTMTMHDWAMACGLKPDTLYNRLSRGWTPEEALSTPTNKRGKRRRLKDLALMKRRRKRHGERLV